MNTMDTIGLITAKCHHKLKYEKYIDNVFYGCSKCDNFVKVKHNVIKENKYE